MGSRTSKRCQRWLTPILSAGHGCAHETQISVCNFWIFITIIHKPIPPTLCSQVGQTSTAEVKKRDLRAELLAAEQDAKNKKRKAEGKPPLGIEDGAPAPEDDESNKRRKLLQEALELDKDDDDDEEEDAKDEKDENERYKKRYNCSAKC